jgi:hypothetical protein
VSRGGRQTWGQGIAIGTTVIAGNRADQLGEGFLIAQLLALANAIRHGERCKRNGHNAMIAERMEIIME